MKTFLCILLLLAFSFLSSYNAWSEIYPDSSEIKVAILEWDLNRNASPNAHYCKRLLSSSGYEKTELLSIEDIADASALNIKKYNIILIPGATRIPALIEYNLSAFHAAGGHIVFIGYPPPNHGWVKDDSGAWVDINSYDVRHMFHSSLFRKHYPEPSSTGPIQLVLKGTGLPERLPRRISISKSDSTRGALLCRTNQTVPQEPALYDCFAYPLYCYEDAQGNVVGEQVSFIRHHCSVYPEATTVFADLSPGDSVFIGNKGAFVLEGIIRLCFTRLPIEKDKDYYVQKRTLKAAVAGLKSAYIDLISPVEDIAFVSEANSALGIPASKDRVMACVSAFQNIEKKVVVLIETFDRVRLENTDNAMRERDELLISAHALSKKFYSLGQEVQGLLKALVDSNAAERGIVEPFLSPQGCIRFGVCDVPTWNKLSIDRITMLKESGFNEMIVYAQKFYSGKPDEAYLKHIQRIFAQTKLKMIPYCALAAEMGEPSDDIKKNYISEGKAEIDYVTGKRSVTPGIVTYSSAAYKDMRWFDALKRTARVYGNEKWVAGFAITAEMSLSAPYNDYTIKKYRKSLEEKYTSIEKLNAVWITGYRNFMEISPPFMYPVGQSDHANWWDWNIFLNGVFEECLRDVNAQMHKVAPEVSTMGALNENEPLSGVDLYSVNRYMDYSSPHSTPSVGLWQIMGLSRRGQQAYHTEYNPTMPGAEPDTKIFRSCAHGQIGFSFYPIWPEGTKPASYALFDTDLYPHLAGLKVGAFIKKVEKWQGLLFSDYAVDRLWADIAVYWPYETRVHCPDLFRSMYGVMDNWDNILEAAHYPRAVITRHHVQEQDMNRYKLIIIPQAIFLEKIVIEKLIAYVKSGGNLLVIGEGGKFDEYMRFKDIILNEGLVVCCPTKAEKINMELSAYKVSPLLQQKGITLPSRCLSYETLFPEIVKTIITYDNGEPACVRTKVGEGTITFLGFSLSNDPDAQKGFFPEKNANVVSTFEKAIGGLGVERIVDADSHNVRLATWKKNGKPTYTFVINYMNNQRKAVLSFKGKIEKVQELETGISLPVRYDAQEKKSFVDINFIQSCGRVIRWQ